MKMNILSAAAARLGTTALTTAAAPTPPAAPLVAPTAAGGAPADGEQVDVVLLTEANAAIAAARAEGAAAELTRTQAVLSSPAGKANVDTAAFMLKHNPTATAESLIEHLGTLTPAPAATTTAAAPGTPAAPAGTAPVTPAAPAATLTVALEQTPAMVVPTTANAGDAENKVDAEKFWGGFTAGATAPALLAGGVPRTGN